MSALTRWPGRHNRMLTNTTENPQPSFVITRRKTITRDFPFDLLFILHDCIHLRQGYGGQDRDAPALSACFAAAHGQVFSWKTLDADVLKIKDTFRVVCLECDGASFGVEQASGTVRRTLNTLRLSVVDDLLV